jgi:hypothetical protein|tara:strand:+ start:938 stop:1327 length:390 start_codon:yes stop_codon:yes gene_type:complete
MPRKKTVRKYMKTTDGRKNNGQKPGDAILRRSLASSSKMNVAKRNRSKVLATDAIRQIYGSEQEFWKLIAENARDSQFDRKMIVEYVYGKPKDYVDLGGNAEKVDISIMNFFEGSKEKTIDIDETTEAE